MSRSDYEKPCPDVVHAWHGDIEGYMVQKISISPEVWARTRRRSFDMDTTASALVEEALVAYLEKPIDPRYEVVKREGGLITEARLLEVSVVSDPPVPEWTSFSPVPKPAPKKSSTRPRR